MGFIGRTLHWVRPYLFSPTYVMTLNYNVVNGLITDEPQLNSLFRNDIFIGVVSFYYDKLSRGLYLLGF